MRTSSLRTVNQRIVLEQLERNVGRSRAELSEATSLTVQALGPILSDLVTAGLAMERVRESAERGRPPVEYVINPLGVVHGVVVVRFVDVVVMVYDAADEPVDAKLVRDRSRNPTPARKLEPAVAALRDLIVANGADPERLESLSVVIEGRVDASRGIVHEAEAWRARDVHIRDVVAHVVPDGVSVEVSSREQAVARHALAAVQAAPDELVAILDLSYRTHLNIARGGELVVARSGRTGDLTHYRVAGNDRTCSCGSTGCLGTVSGGPAVVDEYEHLTGERLPAAVDVMARAGSGDARAATALREVTKSLAAGVAPILDVLAPDRIVVTGAVGAVGSRGLDVLIRTIRSQLAEPDVAIEAVMAVDAMASPIRQRSARGGGAADTDER